MSAMPPNNGLQRETPKACSACWLHSWPTRARSASRMRNVDIFWRASGAISPRRLAGDGRQLTAAQDSPACPAPTEET